MKAWIISGVFWTFLILANKSFCQDISTDTFFVERLIKRIYQLQQFHEKDFPTGLIPSYRQYYHNKETLKNDDNIFFTGLVVFTLRAVRPYLDRRSQLICDSIFARAEPLYTAYQNHTKRPTYNFWRTDKPEIFPNGGWINLFNKRQALPDDLDDTAIILLALNSADSSAASTHQIMQGFTNNTLKMVKSSLPDYRNIQAYSTWFGKKMPVDLDFCVLTNILLMVHKYRLAYTAADSASLQLLSRVVEKRHYMNAATSVSPHYSRTPILLYHLSRLMAETKIPALEKFKPQLVQDATTTYRCANNFFDKVILSSALMRWGMRLPDDTLTINTSMEAFVENNNFVFFIANMTSMFPRPLNTLLGKTGIGKFYYYCPAYNYALLVENISLRKQLPDK